MTIKQSECKDIVGEIVYLYWNHQIDAAEMIRLLARVSPEILASAIEDMVNRSGAMALVIGNCRQKYQDGESPMLSVFRNKRGWKNGKPHQS